MHPELTRLFSDVADLSMSERERYFADHHVGAALRAELDSLLRYDVEAGSALDDAIGAEAQLLTSGDAAWEGRRCGAYRLIRLVGRGGAGAVYFAERVDGEIEQCVAIKLLRPDAEGQTLRDRFLNERQILASLQHPGIARLLDAGQTEDGKPYLVMDYVEGAPIDAYAARLDLRRTLDLFLEVCDAIAYAHRSLVIHRDLKPSNILVDGSGHPKLLDFGIAKILDIVTSTTRTQERRLTPDYASPEQVRGAAQTTATDVYSLGAVLYTLLTGTSPHAFSGVTPEAIDAAICNVEPTPASRVKAELPRDLDFILGKALRKEPGERYASVDALADDVRAFLERRPVRARSGNAWYRTRKLAARHWLPTSAVAAAIASLSIGIYVANSERRIAERRFLQLRQLAAKLTAVDTAVRNLPGSTAARQQMVAASMEYLDGLGRDAYRDRDLMMELAQGYVALAQVQGVPVRPNLGQYDAAVESLRKADVFLQRVLAKEPARPDALAAAAEREQDLMIIADSRRRYDDALAHGARSAEHLDALTRAPNISARQAHDAAITYMNIALAYGNGHRLDEGIRLIRRSVELARTAALPSELAQGLSVLANLLRLSGDLEGALPAIVEARRISESSDYPNELTKSLALYGVLVRQAQIVGPADGIGLDRRGEAIELLQGVYDSMERLAAQDSSDATSRDRVGTTARQLADLVRAEDPERALAIYDRGIQREREIPSNVKARREEAHLLAGSSYALRSLGRHREARERIDRALELLRAAGDWPAATVPPEREPVPVLMALGDLESAAGDASAVRTYRDLVDRIAAGHPDVEYDLREASDTARVYTAFAGVLRRAGRTDEAAAIDVRRLAIWQAWDRRLPGNPFIQGRLQAH